MSERSGTYAEIENAVIESAELGDVGRGGYLDFSIGLEYGSGGQGFCGYALYLPESFSNHTKQSPAGFFVWRILEIAGVEKWSQLVGKTIRVGRNERMGRITAIGHIIKDDWFDPEQDFRVDEK